MAEEIMELEQKLKETEQWNQDLLNEVQESSDLMLKMDAEWNELL